MSDEIITAAVCGFVITILCLWLRSDPATDAECGVNLGRMNELPKPDLLACQCSYCRRVRCSHGVWLPEAQVPLPVGCRVSHGICPSCERRAYAELEAMDTAAVGGAK